MMFKSEDKIIFFVHTSKLCELCLFPRLNVLKAVDGQSISDFPFFRFFSLLFTSWCKCYLNR